MYLIASGRRIRSSSHECIWDINLQTRAGDRLGVVPSRLNSQYDEQSEELNDVLGWADW